VLGAVFGEKSGLACGDVGEKGVKKCGGRIFFNISAPDAFRLTLLC